MYQHSLSRIAPHASIGYLLAAFLLLLTFPMSASASRMTDWQCLTSDLRGDPAIREEYIRASQEASRTFQIAPSILVAIKRTESGLGLNPNVTGNNNNGTVDRGFYQVNTEVWVPVIQRLGVNFDASGLYGVRQNALIAGWIWRRQLNRSDVNGPLEAVGYYHKGGGTDARAHNIRRVYKEKFMDHLRVLISRCS